MAGALSETVEAPEVEELSTAAKATGDNKTPSLSRLPHAGGLLALDSSNPPKPLRSIPTMSKQPRGSKIMPVGAIKTKRKKSKHPLNQPLGFGRYRKRTWAEVPGDYLRWLEANCTDWLNTRLARMELERRRISTKGV